MLSNLTKLGLRAKDRNVLQEIDGIMLIHGCSKLKLWPATGGYCPPTVALALLARVNSLTCYSTPKRHIKYGAQRRLTFTSNRQTNAEMCPKIRCVSRISLTLDYF